MQLTVQEDIESQNDVAESNEEEREADAQNTFPLPDDKILGSFLDQEDFDVEDEHEHDDNVINESTELTELNGKIHEHLNCTRGELLSFVLAFYLRHSLTKKGLQDLLTLLNMMVPGCVPKTLYYLKKFCLGSSVMDVTVHYYCGICEGYMGDNIETNSCASLNITESSKKSLAAGRYFLVKSIESQLQNMLEKTNLWSQMKKNNPYKDRSYVGEVYTGSIYQLDCVKEFLQD